MATTCTGPHPPSAPPPPTHPHPLPFASHITRPEPNAVKASKLQRMREGSDQSLFVTCRAAFDALISKMHVVQLQTHSPKVAVKSINTSHAFVPATVKVSTVAEAVAMTEQLRLSEEAANQEVQTAPLHDAQTL